MTPEHAKLLAQAIRKLLGIKPAAGSMAYIRCLPSETVAYLVTVPEFNITHWTVRRVCDPEAGQAKTISADAAVEIREDKLGAYLLLVDTDHAGAGMDGIYSAAREISERELFKTANELARKALTADLREAAAHALKRAARLGKYNTISPWREFDFYVMAGQGFEAFGQAITKLGFWPIKSSARFNLEDLDMSARMVERLLLAGSLTPPESRVSGLLLRGSTKPQIQELTRFVREAERLPWTEAVQQLANHPSLFLNELHPDVFHQTELQHIDVVDWMGKKGKLLAWSGLIDEDGQLHFKVNPNPESAKDRSKLELRWTTRPDGIAKGAVEYSVSVLSGDEELIERRVTHTDKLEQKCVFTDEDFTLEEHSKFEVKLRVRALGLNMEALSREVIVSLGTIESKVRSTALKPSRCIVDGLLSFSDQDTYQEAAAQYGQSAFDQNAEGITFRQGATHVLVRVPNLWRSLERQWLEGQGQPARWTLTIRGDGSPVGEPQYWPLPFPEQVTDERLKIAAAHLAQRVQQGPGLLGLPLGADSAVHEYIAAWVESLQESPQAWTHLNTLEIRSLTGTPLGSIVLPHHPLRLAWQQAYDALAPVVRYQEGLSAAEARDSLAVLDGTNFPALLPGFVDGQALVFGEILGQGAVAMIPASDVEPKSTSALLARVWQGNLGETDPQAHTATVLAREIYRYLNLHAEYERIHLHALRAGDGLTLGKALGEALRMRVSDKQEPDEDEVTTPLSYQLNLHPSTNRHDVVGRFFTATAERHRTGSGLVPEQDRWMFEGYRKPGDITLSRLTWAKRLTPLPDQPAHLSIAFDIFDQAVIPDANPITAHRDLYGLAFTTTRTFAFDPNAQWQYAFARTYQGAEHPVQPELTQHLEALHALALEQTAHSLGGHWPALSATVSEEKEEALRRLHDLSDWVLTVDRNAGVEYYDSPKASRGIYDAYIIDCVPEREDLSLLQLVTSTSNLNEVAQLLGDSLLDMQLTPSQRNCRYLLEELKGLSGRLAMRLSGAGNTKQEVIALALLHSRCREEGLAPWPSLQHGLLIPLDDIQGAFGEKRSGSRADLVYVSVPNAGKLQFTFVEVKYRRLLKTARDADLLNEVNAQLTASRKRWDGLFNDQPSFRTLLRRTRLGRILKFYLDKAHRHHLSDTAYERLSQELLDLSIQGCDYDLSNLHQPLLPDLGFVFCPEFQATKPSELLGTRNSCWLFGPTNLPEMERSSTYPTTPNHRTAASTILPKSPVASSDLKTLQASPTAHLTTALLTDPDAVNLQVSAATLPSSHKVESNHPETVSIKLGTHQGMDSDVRWNVSIKGNPHLMLVGLPGMGKTTSLINICQQLQTQGITPLVFSYHEDIDAAFEQIFDTVQHVDFNGLGFNPMFVYGSGDYAYVDNVGLLRDIFAGIFTDLGDVQLGRIREALKRSYLDLGWANQPGDPPSTPPFRTFFELLKTDPKPDQPLLMRLSELDDYGFFQGETGGASLLDTANPTLVRIHRTQNETLQRAFAVFVLSKLYKDMFARGPQSKITHAIIFDEAHRASKLKLISTMAKECRKYGLAFVLASQETKDFDASVFNAIANYLVLRLNETDSKAVAKTLAMSGQYKDYVDRIKSVPKFHAYYYGEGSPQPSLTALKAPDEV